MNCASLTLSGRPGAAGGGRLSGSAACTVAPEEGGCPGPGLPGTVPVAGSAVHGGGPEGALQTRPSQHAGLGQEKEARPTGRAPGSSYGPRVRPLKRETLSLFSSCQIVS